jgi:hypothetical protein
VSVTSLVVAVAGRHRTIRGKALKAPVDLTGLPRGRFTVTATLKTATGDVLRLVRKYRTCAARD